MISKEQERLAFLELELKSVGKVLNQLKDDPRSKIEIAYWEKHQKEIVDTIFEMKILMGIDV